MRLYLAIGLVAVVGCRRADEDRDRTNVAPVSPIIEHVLPSVAAPPTPTGPLGTAHPTTIVAVAQMGRWVVMCQARVDTSGDGTIEVLSGNHGELYGDDMQPYLMRGGGDGQAIEELVAVSPDDRWLAVIRAGVLVVIDDRDGRETTISDVDLRPDQRGRSRIATFDADSQRLVYLRADTHDTLVIRELAQPRERVVRLPGVDAWRVVPEVGRWARLLFVRDDTDGNGTVEWPVVHTNAPLGEQCRGPAMAISTFGGGGDRVHVAWIDLDRGAIYEDSSLLAHVDGHDLVRDSAGTIRVGSVGVIPPSCDAEVLAVLANPLRVLASCAPFDATDAVPAGVPDPNPDATRPPRVSLELFGPGFHATLDDEVRRGFDDPPSILDSSIYCAYRRRCFDLATGARIALTGGRIAKLGAAILTQDDDNGPHGPVLWAATPTTTPRILDFVHGYPVARAGSIVALDTGIVDLTDGRVLGFAPTTPIAVDRRGRTLVPATDATSGFPLGPWHWADPLPQPPARD